LKKSTEIDGHRLTQCPLSGVWENSVDVNSVGENSVVKFDRGGKLAGRGYVAMNSSE